MAGTGSQVYRLRYCGSTILMAVVLTMILFIVGFAFMVETQTSLDAAATDKTTDALDRGLIAVTKQIQSVLAEDIDQYFQGELHDYPGVDDRWLASLEPVIWGRDGQGENIYSWPHITDLWADWEPQYRPFPLAAIDAKDGILKLLAVSGQAVPYYDPDGAYNKAEISFDRWQAAGLTRYNYNNPHRYWVSAYNTVAKIISPLDPIVDVVLDSVTGNLAPWHLPYAPYNVALPNAGNPPARLPSGHRADADGDGVADARWHRLTNMIDAHGVYIYAAVRIIDNSGMININTAGHNPVNNGGQWDGTKLTDIDLASLSLHTSDVPEDLFNFRVTGMMHAAATQLDSWTYHHEVARRLQNPNIPCYLFGICDELELRHRFMINSDFKTLSEMVWPYTIAPKGSGSKKRPFRLKKKLHIWYQKVADDYTDRNHGLYNKKSNLYTKRHIMTTMSRSRELRPKSNVNEATLVALGMAQTTGLRKFDIRLPKHLADGVAGRNETSELKQFVKHLAGAIYCGLPSDAIIAEKVSPNDTRITMAWQFALNIIDYQDYDGEAAHTNDRPTHYYNAISNTTYVGVENERTVVSDTLQISEIAAITEKETGTIYYAVEIYNPSADEKTLADGFAHHAYTIEIKGRKPQSFPLTGVISGNGYLVLLGASQKDKKAFEISEALRDNGHDYINPDANIVVNNKIAFYLDDQISIYKKSWLDGIMMPVDTIVVPVMPESEVLQRFERTTFFQTAERIDGVGKLRLHHYDAAIQPSFWTVSTGESLGDPAPILTTLQVDGHDVTIRMQTVNQPLRTIGEIGNIFAIGTQFGDPNMNPPATFIETLSGTILLSNANRFDGNNPLQNYGRINFADPNFWPLFDYLTLIDPASDFDPLIPPDYDTIPVRVGIDNDGKLHTSNVPGADGIDNNYNFQVDEPAEMDDPHLYEHCLNGRININTAPWRVIQRLPWLSYLVVSRNGRSKKPPQSGKGFLRSGHLAMAIVAYRDKRSLTPLEVRRPAMWPLGSTPDYRDIYDIKSAAVGSVLFEGRRSQLLGKDAVADRSHIRVARGFATIAEVLHVRSYDFASNTYIQAFDIRKYLDSHALEGPPNYDAETGHINDDFLERDVLFQRISDLITVRSDVFTAYILLRYGKRGPQRRYMVMFDRSNVFSSADTPRIVISHRIESE